MVLKVLKYGVGEGWKRSHGPFVWEIKKCYKEFRMRVCPAWNKNKKF